MSRFCMRLSATIFFLLIIVCSSCTKEKAIVVYESLDELNDTEVRIAGKWYLKSKTDTVYDLFTQELDRTQTTSYNNFNQNNYIDFTAKRHILAKENPFDYPDAKNAFLSSKTISTSQLGEPINPNYYTMYWFINESNNELNIYDERFNIKLLNDHQLIIVYDTDKFTNSTITSVFER